MERKESESDSTKQESDSNWIRELDSRIGFDKKRIENAHPYLRPVHTICVLVVSVTLCDFDTPLFVASG